ncbi:MAG: tyrosine-type recombinase/integrase [Streptosporangiaceae bacterium]
MAQVPQARQGCTAADKDGIVAYTAHELRHVCASLLIASGASDMQVAHQMGHSRVETTKNIAVTPVRPGPGRRAQRYERGGQPTARLRGPRGRGSGREDEAA